VQPPGLGITRVAVESDESGGGRRRTLGLLTPLHADTEQGLLTLVCVARVVAM
jgi:hypothetical protein